MVISDWFFDEPSELVRLLTLILVAIAWTALVLSSSRFSSASKVAGALRAVFGDLFMIGLSVRGIAFIERTRAGRNRRIIDRSHSFRRSCFPRPVWNPREMSPKR